MQALIDVLLPVFLVIGFGWVLTRFGAISAATVDGLTLFAQRVALPALLFTAVARIDLAAVFLPGMLLAFYAGAVCGFLAGLFAARLIFRRSWEDAVVVGFVCLFSNSLMLGIPIAERAYGAEALPWSFAIVVLHAPVCYLIGITVMEAVQTRGRGLLAGVGRVITSMAGNPLMIGIALGVAVNLSGVSLPGALSEALRLVVATALPAALFGLGGVLARYRPEGDLRLIACVCLVSLVLHPAITWGLVQILSPSVEATRAAVLTAAMAPGVNGYIFATLYGRAMRVAASSVLLATLLSTPTVWVWLQILP